MIYRTIGNSDLKLSAITFGAWAAGGWMWGGNDRQQAIEAMHASYELGVTSIDTAPVYGQGDSEVIVGEAIRSLPRDKVQILTKFGMRWDLQKGDFAFKSKNNNGADIDIFKYAARDSIVLECENSLRRLGTDYIDLYQIHWPDVTTPIGETMETLQLLIRQGKIRYAAVCNYSKAQLEEARTHINVVSDQVPYSMVKRGIEKELLPYCIEQNIGVLAYSPLERGLLTGKIKPGHSFAEGDHRARLAYYSDENVRRTNSFLERIRPIAEVKKVSISQLVLKWTIEQPGISVALVGARNAEQAEQNAKAIDVPLNDEEIRLITSELDKLSLLL